MFVQLSLTPYPSGQDLALQLTVRYAMSVDTFWWDQESIYDRGEVSLTKQLYFMSRSGVLRYLRVLVKLEF